MCWRPRSTAVAKQSDPSIGAITAVIDESADADKLVGKPEVATINDLRGKRIAYSSGSVGEYFLYYALSLAGMGPQDVTLVPQEEVADAVQQYLDGQVDAVSAWEPDVLTAEEQGAKVVIASDKLRAILDVLVTARPALDTKAEAVQAFHDAWFEALKITIDTPDQAEQAIIDWGHSDWTFVENPGDFTGSLGSLAQATLGANQIAFQQPSCWSAAWARPRASGRALARRRRRSTWASWSMGALCWARRVAGSSLLRSRRSTTPFC